MATTFPPPPPPNPAHVTSITDAIYGYRGRRYRQKPSPHYEVYFQEIYYEEKRLSEQPSEVRVTLDAVHSLVAARRIACHEDRL